MSGSEFENTQRSEFENTQRSDVESTARSPDPYRSQSPVTGAENEHSQDAMSVDSPQEGLFYFRSIPTYILTLLF